MAVSGLLCRIPLALKIVHKLQRRQWSNEQPQREQRQSRSGSGPCPRRGPARKPSSVTESSQSSKQDEAEQGGDEDRAGDEAVFEHVDLFPLVPGGARQHTSAEVKNLISFRPCGSRSGISGFLGRGA